MPYKTANISFDGSHYIATPKVNLQREWSYFCTFTFSDEKHTEESFRKSLRNTLKHLVNRKGWKHIGVWERGGETGRLHFHGIFSANERLWANKPIMSADISTAARTLNRQ